MAEAALEARTLLWEWVGELDDDDPEQRAWKHAHCVGLVDAAAAAGVLPPEEIAQWRRLLAGHEPPPARGDAATAARHLDGLLAGVQPMSRDPSPEELAAGSRLHAAVGALHAAGILDDGQEREWRARALAVEAPWLDDEERSQVASASGFVAIAVPPASPEEAAADAAAQAHLEAMSRRGRARRVFVPERVIRHDGLAIVAVVARSESTEVAFHHVGGPQGEVGTRAHLEALRAAVAGLVAPALCDDGGAVYEPVQPEPVAAHSTGGSPDPQRPRVTSGVWRYQPAASDGATAFTARSGAATWCLA